MVVMNETQSLIKVRGVVPVMSSHWAGVVPPVMEQRRRNVGAPPDPTSPPVWYSLIIPLPPAA